MSHRLAKKIRKIMRENNVEITSVKGRQVYKRAKRYYKRLKHE